ncbi:hypothetical protein PIB30_004635 [Stylosanthes scabra]|uniref:Uncharacterized protein n=1 Tax=Stylosanthes scabra TaxID=79078 RepID=A0ABU6Q4F9_9FABA|nr:hypothetical protein [Stylosanthes scabra]
MDFCVEQKLRKKTSYEKPKDKVVADERRGTTKLAKKSSRRCKVGRGSKRGGDVEGDDRLLFQALVGWACGKKIKTSTTIEGFEPSR